LLRNHLCPIVNPDILVEKSQLAAEKLCCPVGLFTESLCTTAINLRRTMLFHGTRKTKRGNYLPQQIV